MPSIFFITIVTLILLFPKDLFAWGLGTHLQLGLDILNNLSYISPYVAEIISRFPYDYLYGCIGADITVGKRFVDYKYHCHNWKVALSLLKEVEILPQRSFIYGYLSHLASDVISHNYYIPNQIIATFPKKMLKHLYWEMRFDTYMEEEIWFLGKELVKRENIRGNINDVLLSRTLRRTIFSFETNKKIFNGILLLNSINQWQKAMQILHSQSHWVLSPAEIDEYYRLSLDSTLQFLKVFEKARCLKEDPTGNMNLKKAALTRKYLKRLFKRRSYKPYIVAQIVCDIQSQLRNNIYRCLYESVEEPLEETSTIFTSAG